MAVVKKKVCPAILWRPGEEPEDCVALATSVGREAHWHGGRIYKAKDGRAGVLWYRGYAYHRADRHMGAKHNELATRFVRKHKLGSEATEIYGDALLVWDEGREVDCIQFPKGADVVEMCEAAGETIPGRGTVCVDGDFTLWYAFTTPRQDENQHLADLAWANLRFS
ncbi:hypothetical protein [Mesorhizobium sp. KR2-14]|uniref:hypothetical protein n=1 Tax=Mesorhizobium sp. KR2-14 TaxID=3156610 RepID=UPI0032B418BB